MRLGRLWTNRWGGWNPRSWDFYFWPGPVRHVLHLFAWSFYWDRFKSTRRG